MRIWDIPVQNLCRQHLLGEHRELHAIFVYLTTDKGGSYKKHPETLRWKNYLEPLILRHENQVEEMERRGYKHSSPLKFDTEERFISFPFWDNPPPITPLAEQLANLRAKGCECKLDNLV